MSGVPEWPNCEAKIAELEEQLDEAVARAAVLTKALNRLMEAVLGDAGRSPETRKAFLVGSDALKDTSPAVAELLMKVEELKHFHELTGMDGLELEKALDEATGLKLWSGDTAFRELLAK